jgi:hypothetical protein
MKFKGALPMRTFVAATVAATLIATSALAAVTSPLPSGKPAGVKKAQEADNTVWWVVGLGAVAAGVGLVASGNSTVVTTTTK